MDKVTKNQALLFKFRQQHLPGGQKPQLDDYLMNRRIKLAEYLLQTDLKTIVSIYQANTREEHALKSCWHSPEEYLHSDVKQPTTKQDYQKAEFMGAIKWEELPGPAEDFKKETANEIQEAYQLLKRLQAEEAPRVKAEFEASEKLKEIAASKGQKRKGKKPTLENYMKRHGTIRRDRKNGGYDWLRVTSKYIEPLLDPWIEELQEKENLRISTRRHESRIEVVMDNASAQRSKYTNKIMNLLDIVRVAWPAQSPDWNPSERAWDYVRAQIKKKNLHCHTEEKCTKAWEEEWALIPQR
ncbi:uncharacterized protein RAG0_02841 [Rhynchosporium agropyri]|uniref:Tc1-like transposase DDE domain-containing protein n=1 Tax=Rhynchosporium agropyri TaxID=914238 RepID=A0A1E1K2W6_9HELO|nr:uncharacterized protein RAG0_02841 [Rhynchosporium agropyri]